jgi:hypothetical protein
MFARICVSGFLLDPEVPVSTLFASPFATHPVITNNLTVNINSASVIQPPIPLSRGFTHRLQVFGDRLTRPFALFHHSQYSSQPPDEVQSAPVRRRTDPPNSETLLTRRQPFTRDPSQPVHLSSVLKPERSDTISLPFELSVTQLHDKMHRNVPYLRQSWGRIDFIAVVSFWITFGLATAGVERGSHHIGIFRAMSVLRTARLLTITSGTTVSTMFPFPARSP